MGDGRKYRLRVIAKRSLIRAWRRRDESEGRERGGEKAGVWNFEASLS